MASTACSSLTPRNNAINYEDDEEHSVKLTEELTSIERGTVKPDIFCFGKLSTPQALLAIVGLGACVGAADYFLIRGTKNNHDSIKIGDRYHKVNR
jgi:hypothetical protein